jgi:prolipoprotein diacylglyceryl transferase
MTARIPPVFASIPSPSFNSLKLGPLNLNVYGLAIALGVIAGVWLFGRRLEERGVGTSDDASGMAVWAVLGGVIGARLYHVATDWERFSDNYSAIPKIWEGGLGIPGGLALGTAVGFYMAKKRGIPLSTAATCAAPAVPLAQSIGRWGNYFNQELYGRPTKLPWALEIDADHLVSDPATGAEFALGTTFHPTFLYESLWSLALCGLLLYIDRRWRPGGGALFGLFVAGYGIGRFWVEGLRVDPADEIGPLRLNQWVALAAVAVGLAVFISRRRRPEIGPDAAGDIDPNGEDGDLGDVDGDDALDAADLDTADLDTADLDDAADLDELAESESAVDDAVDDEVELSDDTH